MDLLWFVLVGLIAGWLAGQIVKGGGFGVVGDIAVGILGALIGGYLFRSSVPGPGGSSSGLLISILIATVGAILLIIILRLIKRA